MFRCRIHSDGIVHQTYWIPGVKVFHCPAGLERMDSSTYNRYESLRANLVHCLDLGRAAFWQAETKMGKVCMYTQYICEANGPVSNSADTTLPLRFELSIDRF